MYTYLPNHIYLIRYTNNPYVRFQMLQVSAAQLLSFIRNCRSGYSVNLVALRWSWRIILDDKLESNRQQAIKPLRFPTVLVTNHSGVAHSRLYPIRDGECCKWQLPRPGQSWELTTCTCMLKVKPLQIFFKAFWDMVSYFIVFVHIHHIYHPW